MLKYKTQINHLFINEINCFKSTINDVFVIYMQGKYEEKFTSFRLYCNYMNINVLKYKIS